MSKYHHSAALIWRLVRIPSPGVTVRDPTIPVLASGGSNGRSASGTANHVDVIASVATIESVNGDGTGPSENSHSRKNSSQAVQVTQYPISDRGANSNQVTANSNSIEVYGYELELPEIDGWDDVPDYDDIPGAPDISVSCGQCKTIFERACILGCGVSVGTICLFIGGPITGLACGVVASIACYVIDYLGVDACAPASDEVAADTFCDTLDFC